MHPHIKALRGLLRSAATPFTEIPGFDDAILVNGKPFIRSTTPFNSESAATLCHDKIATYRLMEGVITTPKTLSFFDPKGRFAGERSSIESIIERSLSFLYPRVVKMNSGQSGRNVFITYDESEFKRALETIFDPSLRDYDHIALVQEYIDYAFEYRVAVASGKARFAYVKGVYDSIDREREKVLLSLAQKVAETSGLSWGSVDFLESKDGRIYFLEINTRPLYDGYIAKNGDEKIKELFAKALCIAWDSSSNISISSSLQASPARLS